MINDSEVFTLSFGHSVEIDLAVRCIYERLKDALHMMNWKLYFFRNKAGHARAVDYDGFSFRDL